jgi:hypothetical protein
MGGVSPSRISSPSCLISKLPLRLLYWPFLLESFLQPYNGYVSKFRIVYIYFASIGMPIPFDIVSTIYSLGPRIKAENYEGYSGQDPKILTYRELKSKKLLKSDLTKFEKMELSDYSATFGYSALFPGKFNFFITISIFGGKKRNFVDLKIDIHLISLVLSQIIEKVLHLETPETFQDKVIKKMAEKKLISSSFDCSRNLNGWDKEELLRFMFSNYLLGSLTPEQVNYFRKCVRDEDLNAVVNQFTEV